MDPLEQLHADRTLRSVQVCLNCKARKRKCSKTRPTCDLCSKLLIKCVYTPTLPQKSLPFHADCVQGSTFDTRSSSESSPDSRSNILQNHATGPTSNWLASAEFLASAFGIYQDEKSAASISFNTSTMNEVLQLLVLHRGSLPTLISEYFRTIDVWFPSAVSQISISRRVKHEPSSELALLILSMFLIVQLPDSKIPNPDSMRTGIYFAAKSLLHTLISAGGSSVDIMQACIWVSLYEAGHGMLSQARFSITLCSNFVMKLLSSQQQLGISAAQESNENRLLWSIIMLDRYINLGVSSGEVILIPNSSIMQSRVFLNSHEGGSTASSALTSFTPASNSETLERLAAFSQAVDMLGRVLEYTKSLYAERYFDFEKCEALDKPLQSLLVELLRHSTRSWEDSCETIGLCISALLILHKARYDISSRQTESPPDIDQKRLALMAIKSIVNMVIEISVSFNARIAYIDLPALPLPSTSAIYQAAMLHIDLSFDRFGTQSWNDEMGSLKTSLDRYGTRWSVGKMYLQHIENATRQEILSRASIHGSYK